MIQKKSIYKYKQTISDYRLTSGYKTTHKTGTDVLKLLELLPQLFSSIHDSCPSLGSLPLRRVTDIGRVLATDVGCLAVDDEVQGRVHSYASEVERLPEEGKRVSRASRGFQRPGWETLTSSLCVMLFCLTWGSGTTTVSPISTPQLLAELNTITTTHVSSLSTMPNVLQEQEQHVFLHRRTPSKPLKPICTYKAIVPSEVRLNTTLPKAATPALLPCLREEKVHGSRLPTWPIGDWNWGEAQGPKADVFRFESIDRNRRVFTFPWRDGVSWDPLWFQSVADFLKILLTSWWEFFLAMKMREGLVWYGGWSWRITHTDVYWLTWFWPDKGNLNCT